MNSQQSIAVILAAGLLAIAPVAEADTCRVTHGGTPYTADFDVDADMRLRDGDIVFQRDRVELARLTRDRRLLVDGRDVQLGEAERQIVGEYVASFERLMAEARAIGMGGARLGMRAAFGAVRAIFVGTEARADFEKDIEEQAAELEARGAAMCIIVSEMRTHHEALAGAVPEFAAAVPLKD